MKRETAESRFRLHLHMVNRRVQNGTSQGYFMRQQNGDDVADVSAELAKWPEETSQQDRHNTMWGVSIILCSHNGASRLSATMASLATQEVPAGLPWEVVVVDNASTDRTAAAASENWPTDAPCPLRLVYEPQVGLTQARCRGLREAQYELVSFVDDDNWPAPDWIHIVADVMGRHPELGACGGALEASCECPPPGWFDRVQKYYAVGQQCEHGGDITWSRGYLWGAGLTVRKSAWEELINSGFRFHLSDRAGRKAASGGDAELCLALRLAGWKLWYEPTMTMKHFIPSSRLEWKYLEQITRGFGAAAVVLNAYATVRQSGSWRALLWMRSNWWCQASITILRLLGASLRGLLGIPKREGNEAVLDMIYRREALGQFLRIRTGYDALCRDVQQMSSRTRMPGLAGPREA